MASEASAAPLEGLAKPRGIIARAAGVLRPPKRMRLSEWADAKFYLSAESAAEPGRWRTIPYQRGIMDAITDPAVRKVSVMKSARVGWTKMLDAAIGYYMEQDPCPILAVQPTVEDAEGYSKEEIDPMLRDCPALRNVVAKARKRDSANTILHKKFPGGVLSMVGANSGRGFRRVSRKVICLDEVDAYPPSAGSDGDPIPLAITRSEFYWDRKILLGSTPLVAGTSKIAEEFADGDQRRYHIPCPHCGHMDYLVFRKAERGHVMRWDEGKPETAHFVCSGCGERIEHKHKRWMVERGEWIAEAPFKNHASFAIWAAYSYSPNSTWADIAEAFVKASAGGTEKLRTVINTVIGEPWVEKGEAPEWKRLYERRENYAAGTVPEGVLFLTAGVDVQRDRLVYEIVGWGPDKQSWSVEAGILPGDTSNEEAGAWIDLNALLERRWVGASGVEHPIHKLAVDSGDQTQTVYNWVRGRSAQQVIAVKGVATATTLYDAPKKVDVNARGKRKARGVQVWPVGTAVAKRELYGWLRLQASTDEQRAAGLPDFPPGFCHFSRSNTEEFFRQLTAEHLVSAVNKRTRRVTKEWQVLPGRENHWLDCRVYARAAAAVAQLDQIAASHAAKARAPAPVPPKPAEPRFENEAPDGHAHLRPPAPSPQAPRASSWLGGRGGSWLRR